MFQLLLGQGVEEEAIGQLQLALQDAEGAAAQYMLRQSHGNQAGHRFLPAGMMTSSPFSARSKSLERLVLAAWTV